MNQSIEHINAKINSFKNDPEYMGKYLISLIDESTEIERALIMAIISISERIKK